MGTESAPANIHGGGYGASTIVTRNVDVTLGKAVGQDNPVVVYGDVYGGSAQGMVNGTAATTQYHTTVTMNAGMVHGDIYGGGLGTSTNAANVHGSVTVNIHGGEAERVFGCNNVNGRPMQNTNHVNMDGGRVGSVYGGGNAAGYAGTPYVDMSGGMVTDNVFGGGLGANAVVTGNTDVTIRGTAKVQNNVYGGGNAAKVTGNTYVKVQ